MEFATWSNGLITDFRKGTFRAVLSQGVVAEVEDAPLQVRRVHEELVTKIRFFGSFNLSHGYQPLQFFLHER